MCQHSLILQGNNNLNFEFTDNKVIRLETSANLCASRHQVNNFLQVFLFWSWAGTTKHLMTFPTRNSKFCFLSATGTLRVMGKQNSLFPLGPVIKCLLFIIFLIFRTPKRYRAVFRYETPSKKRVSIILDTLCYVESILFPFLGLTSIFDLKQTCHKASILYRQQCCYTLPYILQPTDN